MRRPSVVAILAAILAATVLTAAPAARAAHHRRTSGCAPRSSEKLLRQNGVAVLLTRRIPAMGETAIVGCSRATGRRRIVATSVSDFEVQRRYRVIGFRGSAVLLTSSFTDTHEAQEALIVDDAVHAGRRRLLAGGPAISVTAAALRSDGTAAWTEQVGSGRAGAAGEVLRVSTPDGAVRVLDSGAALEDVGITSSDVRWRHGDAPLAAAVRPPDACDGAYASGSQEVGVHFADSSLSACDRSTGRTATVSIAFGDPGAALRSLAFGGGFVAAPSAGGIVVLDTSAATTTTVPAPSVADVVVSDRGWLAWLREARPTDPAAKYDVMIRDGGGERLVGSAAAGAGLVVDGATVRWSPTQSIALEG